MSTRAAGGAANTHRVSGRSAASAGAVDLPGLWTPGRRGAESGSRRNGRPQTVGNLAEECRGLFPAFRPRDSHRSTAVADEGIHPSERSVPEARRGPGSATEYTLTTPSNCPNNRDHVTLRAGA